MQDLEQRAQQLVRDWQALRQRLERVQQEQRFGQFYTMHLDAIEASLVDVPGLVYCIVTDMTTPDPAAGISTHSTIQARTATTARGWIREPHPAHAPGR